MYYAYVGISMLSNCSKKGTRSKDKSPFQAFGTPPPDPRCGPQTHESIWDGLREDYAKSFSNNGLNFSVVTKGAVDFISFWAFTIIDTKEAKRNKDKGTKWVINISPFYY